MTAYLVTWLAVGLVLSWPLFKRSLLAAWYQRLDSVAHVLQDGARFALWHWLFMGFLLLWFVLGVKLWAWWQL